MAFNGSFTITQPSVDPTTFGLVDISTGSDGNLTDRRIYLFKSDGTTLVPPNNGTTYIDWPIASGNSITLTGILAQDYSLNVQVIWVSSSPLSPPSTYTYTILNTFLANLYNFSYNLSEMQSGNPLLITDNGWIENKSKLLVWINDAINATSNGNQFLAQQSINQAYKLVNNQQVYFQ